MRVGLALSAVLLLAACAGAPQQSPIATSSPGQAPAASPSPANSATAAPTLPIGPTVPAATPTPGQSAGEGWRQLGSGLWLDDPFTVAASTNAAQLDELWASLGQAQPAPAVDFEREIVLFLGMSGSSTCPEQLVGLFADEAAARVYGQWAAHDPGQACTDDLQAQGVLLAVDRELLPSGPFLLSLREQPICPECSEQTDQKLIDPAS